MSTRTAIVTGASRGFGRATAIALVNAGVHVIGVGRDREQLDAVRDEAGAEFTPVAADAADPVTAGRLVDTYHPDILVLNAGAHPLLRPLHKYSWETFSSNWEVDVRHVFIQSMLLIGFERVADCLLGWCGFCQVVPGALQQTVGRRGADVEQSCDLRRSKRQHVAQQQHGALPRRQMLKCCHERQPDALPLLNDVCRIRWY